MKKRPIYLPPYWVQLFIALAISTVCFSSLSHAQVYTKDNNVWVYSDLFVQRFGFSPEYVSSELKGARAVAIRLVPLTRLRCHKTGKDEECVPSYQWLLDLYIDIDQDIGLEGNAPRQFKPWRSSLYFLARKDPSLQSRWEVAFGLKGGKLYLVGKDGTHRPVEFDIFSYKRPVEKGLQMIQAKINDDIIMAAPVTARVIEFESKDGTILHRVTIPQSYWPRVAEYHKKYPVLTSANWQGGVETDNNLWVYTREFADKYDLPPSGISGEMEGAMAIAFRKDSYGTESCGYFSKPDVCRMGYTMFWDVYLPSDATLYYADETIDNFYGGYHSSNIFVRELHNNWRGTYPHLVSYKGLQGGAHVYRYRKRKFFNLIKTKEKTRWYGGPLWDQSYLQPQVLNAGFAFAEFHDSITTMAEEHYLIINSSPNVIRLRDLYNSNFHKVRIPTAYRADVLAYVKNFEEKNGSIIRLVESHLKAEREGARK